MAQSLIVHTALIDELGSVLSTHVGWLTTPVTPPQGDLVPLASTGTCVLVYIPLHLQITYTHKISLYSRDWFRFLRMLACP